MDQWNNAMMNNATMNRKFNNEQCNNVTINNVKIEQCNNKTMQQWNNATMNIQFNNEQWNNTIINNATMNNATMKRRRAIQNFKIAINRGACLNIHEAFSSDTLRSTKHKNLTKKTEYGRIYPEKFINMHLSEMRNSVPIVFSTPISSQIYWDNKKEISWRVEVGEQTLSICRYRLCGFDTERCPNP